MTKNVVRKGHCDGCPWNYGNEATEMAYNLGCLPSTGEARAFCGPDHSWPCHSEPDKVCCGDAENRDKPLKHMKGVHTRVEIN